MSRQRRSRQKKLSQLGVPPSAAGLQHLVVPKPRNADPAAQPVATLGTPVLTVDQTNELWLLLQQTPADQQPSRQQRYFWLGRI